MFRKKVKKMPKGYDKTFTPKIIGKEWRKILLDYHFFCAKNYIEGRDLLHKIFNELPKSQQLRMYKAMNKMSHAQSLLDDHYHGLISDEEFVHWGHLWYSEDGKIYDRHNNAAKEITK